MSDDLQRLQEEAANKRKELEELEIAIRVLRRVRGDDATASAAATVPVVAAHANGAESADDTAMRDLFGQTMAEVCEMILRERGNQPTYYRDIAEAAMARGYTSGRKNRGPDALIQSFWATMKRKPELFESVGKGRFRLRR